MRHLGVLIVAIGLAVTAAPPLAWARPAGADLGMTLYLEKQARLQAIAYSEMRASVEDGRRPAGDLEAARRSLKAAQSALYDQIEETQRSNAALFGDLRKQNARRLKAELVLVRSQEAELPLVAGPDRPNAEARLALSRQVLEGYQANALRLSNQPLAASRPKLPILPPHL